jgi:hypothetical protein
LKEYQGCPEIKFTGAHLVQLRACIYCAEIFRRYHKTELEKYEQEKAVQEELGLKKAAWDKDEEEE